MNSRQDSCFFPTLHERKSKEKCKYSCLLRVWGQKEKEREKDCYVTQWEWRTLCVHGIRKDFIMNSTKSFSEAVKNEILCSYIAYILAI